MRRACMCIYMLYINLYVAKLWWVIVFTSLDFPSCPFPSVLLYGNRDTWRNNKYYIDREVKGRFLCPKPGSIQPLHLRIWACFARSTRFLLLIIEKCSVNMPTSLIFQPSGQILWLMYIHSLPELFFFSDVLPSRRYFCNCPIFFSLLNTN